MWQLILLVRIDQVAIGDAIHINDDVHYSLSIVGAAGVVLHEKREVVAVVRSDRLRAHAVLRRRSVSGAAGWR